MECRFATCTNLPEELAEPGMIARLDKTMYGTEDASHIWGETSPKALEPLREQ